MVDLRGMVERNGAISFCEHPCLDKPPSQLHPSFYWLSPSLTEGLAGKTLYPHVCFKNITVQAREPATISGKVDQVMWFVDKSPVSKSRSLGEDCVGTIQTHLNNILEFPCRGLIEFDKRYRTVRPTHAEPLTAQTGRERSAAFLKGLLRVTFERRTTAVILVSRGMRICKPRVMKKIPKDSPTEENQDYQDQNTTKSHKQEWHQARNVVNWLQDGAHLSWLPSWWRQSLVQPSIKLPCQ